jgi:hypothetical protein
MSSNVIPFVVTTSRTVVKFDVSCQSVSLFNNAVLRVDSYDADNNIVDRQIITLTNEQYLAWNNDDSYIINLVATLLGYVIVPPA